MAGRARRHYRLASVVEIELAPAALAIVVVEPVCYLRLSLISNVRSPGPMAWTVPVGTLKCDPGTSPVSRRIAPRTASFGWVFGPYQIAKLLLLTPSASPRKRYAPGSAARIYHISFLCTSGSTGWFWTESLSAESITFTTTGTCVTSFERRSRQRAVGDLRHGASRSLLSGAGRPRADIPRFAYRVLRLFRGPARYLRSVFLRPMTFGHRYRLEQQRIIEIAQYVSTPIDKALAAFTGL